MSKRLGRKPKSQIRDEIVELLYFLKEAYGYELYKKYCKVFDKKISMRSIYYHLNKGVELGIFNLKEIRDVKKGEGLNLIVKDTNLMNLLR